VWIYPLAKLNPLAITSADASNASGQARRPAAAGWTTHVNNSRLRHRNFGKMGAIYGRPPLLENGSYTWMKGTALPLRVTYA